ncbi:hypothetical protein UT300005_01220 [Clostridium sp. CTA-5]
MINTNYYTDNDYLIPKIEGTNKILDRHTFNSLYYTNKKMNYDKSFKETLNGFISLKNNKSLLDKLISANKGLIDINDISKSLVDIDNLSESLETNKESLYNKIKTVRALKNK